MSENRKQLQLRRRMADRIVVRSLLVATLVFVAMVGVVAVFARLKQRAQREATRNAQLDGRLAEPSR